MIIIFDILKGTSHNMQAKDMERLGKEDLVVLDHALNTSIRQLGFVHSWYSESNGLWMSDFSFKPKLASDPKSNVVSIWTSCHKVVSRTWIKSPILFFEKNDDTTGTDSWVS